MGFIDSGSKSSRLLASRRYTHNTFTTAQESFTNVLDLRAEEIYTQAHYVPSSGLPFSGSSQHGSIHQASGSNLMKYWYRHKLTPSNTNTEVWFFLNPTGSDSGIGAQLIDDNQQTNFISPKYSVSSLANATTEDDTPGYGVIVYKSSTYTQSNQTGSLGSSDIVSTNDYIFDYKTGVLQFLSSDHDPASNEVVFMTAYQYVGKTLATGLDLTGDITASNMLLSGNITLGDADTDSIQINAEYSGSMIPDVDNVFDLGSNSKQWKDLYVNGTAYIDTFDALTSTGDISGSSLEVGSYVSASGIRSNDQVNINSDFAQLRLSDDGFSDFISLGQSGTVGYLKTSDSDNNFKFRRGSDNTDLVEIYFGTERVHISGSGGLDVTGHVTASGAVSASGNISAGTLNVAGNSQFAQITGSSISASGDLVVIGTGSMGKVVGDLTEIIDVTVGSHDDPPNSRYVFEGEMTPNFTIDEGKTYRFDQSDSSNDGHPFRFSTTINGTHGGGSEYNTNVGTSGVSPGELGSYIEIKVDKDTPNALYYYCSAHAGMGQSGLLQKNDFTNLHFISGSSVSSGSLGKLVVDGKLSLPSITDVSASLAAAIAGGDNLGNHTATQVLNMDGNNITNVANITNTGTITNVSTTHVTASGTITGSAVYGTTLGQNTGGGLKTITIESNSTVNQDLTTDANPTFADLTLTGDLTVQGDTTTLSTTNLTVQDAFVFTATGSAASNVDGGLIVQSGSAVDSGSAIYHDTQDERWAVAKGVAADGTAVTPTAYVTTTVTANHNPDTTSGSYGVGEQWVNTTTDDIWIRVE
jgi:hypothetical protein